MIFSHLPELDPIRFGNKTFRIVNNEAGRIARLLACDWEIVTLEGSNRTDTVYKFNRGEDTAQQTSEVVRNVGRGRDSKSTEGVLMMKDIDLYKEDEVAEHEDRMNSIESSLIRGANQSDSKSDRADGVKSYAPKINGQDNVRGYSIQKAFNER